MKQSEMQSLVDSLAKQRKRHLDQIEAISIKDIKEMVKLSFIKIFPEKKVLCSQIKRKRRTYERSKI